MNRYESYKPSDIDWIGEIPSHWETVQPKYKLNRVTRPIDDEDEVITCFRDGVVTLRKNRREDGFTNSIKEHGYQQIHPGDLVVHEMDGFAGAIGISDSKGKSTPVYTVVEPDDRADLKYIAYLLREMSQTGKIESLARSIRERTTDFRWNMWSVINFPFPPIEEQKLISCYLDNKTSQIDSLVEKIQKKIELLKEQRNSLINHYVTKGLNPSSEMKDSGIEWIGEIPKHWYCKKLKYISNITYGISPHESTYNDEGRGAVLVNGPVEYSTTDFGYTRSIKWTTDPKNMVPKGSLLFCVRGSTTGRMNICHQDVSIGRGVCSIEAKLDQDFTVFSMMMIRIYIQDQISGSTFPSVVKEDVDNFVLPCPPIEEQREISKFLTKKVDVIDQLIDRHHQKKDHLIEYRQSIISSVVTGKIRVTEDMI